MPTKLQELKKLAFTSNDTFKDRVEEEAEKIAYSFVSAAGTDLLTACHRYAGKITDAGDGEYSLEFFHKLLLSPKGNEIKLITAQWGIPLKTSKYKEPFFIFSYFCESNDKGELKGTIKIENLKPSQVGNTLAKNFEKWISKFDR